MYPPIFSKRNKEVVNKCNMCLCNPLIVSKRNEEVVGDGSSAVYWWIMISLLTLSSGVVTDRAVG